MLPHPPYPGLSWLPTLVPHTPQVTIRSSLGDVRGLWLQWVLWLTSLPGQESGSGPSSSAWPTQSTLACRQNSAAAGTSNSYWEGPLPPPSDFHNEPGSSLPPHCGDLVAPQEWNSGHPTTCAPTEGLVGCCSTCCYVLLCILGVYQFLSRAVFGVFSFYSILVIHHSEFGAKGSATTLTGSSLWFYCVCSMYHHYRLVNQSPNIPIP